MCQVALREVEEQLETIDVSEELSPQANTAAFTESKVIATVNPMQLQEPSQDLNEYERRDNLLMEVGVWECKYAHASMHSFIIPCTGIRVSQASSSIPGGAEIRPTTAYPAY